MKIGALAARQRWAVGHSQLLGLGLGEASIRHAVASGRLHRRWPGVYAVGRAALGREGEWIAALLTCGAGAVLSHLSAAVLWAIWPSEAGRTEITVPEARRVRREGIAVHRARHLGEGDVTVRRGIPVTRPARTLIDLAARFAREPLEAAVNEAVKLGLVRVEGLRAAVGDHRHHAGVRALGALLDARAFRLTDSQLERCFIPLALEAGLDRPLTRQRVNGYRVDFYWPDLGLVVETDGAGFHRTAAQQTRDRRRDQAHTAAGLTQLRFTHDQVAHDPAHVVAVLAQVARRLWAEGG